MKFFEKWNPWILGILIGIGAGIVLGIILQSAVMGFTIGAGIAIMSRNIIRESRRKKA